MTTENNTNPELASLVDQTKKTVSNPATQTLFRFVSLRNPQLAKRKDNLKFIFRDETIKGIFDDLLKEWKKELKKSKIDFLIEKIKNNDPAIVNIRKTEKEASLHFGDFYISSKTLVTDGSISSSRVSQLKTMLHLVDLPILWDSIIYQIITQENFYIKELLIQILQTVHYVNNYDSFSAEPNSKKKEEKQKEIATAKAVIPDYIFIDSASDDGEVTIASKPFTVQQSEVGGRDFIAGEVVRKAKNRKGQFSYKATEEMQKRQNAAIASYEKSKLEQLKKDLLKTKKLYDQQYSQSYDLALNDYQKLVKPLRDNYNGQLLQVEAAFTEEMTSGTRRLALSQVVKPKIPEFQFEFRKERDITFLQKKLSESSLYSFANLVAQPAAEDLPNKLASGDIAEENILSLGEETFVLPADEHLTFEEIIQTVNDRLNELDDEIYQNTEVEKQEYVSVGGILIPVNKDNISGKSSDKPFTAITIATGNSWGLLLTFEDRSLGIVNASYQAITSNMTVTDGSISKESNGVFRLFSGNNTLPVNSFQNGFMVKGEFTLSDGQKYSINFTMIRMSSTPSSTGANGYLTGGGALTLITLPDPDPDTPDNPGNPDTPTNPGTSTQTTNNSFIPTGFGVTRLGIADYLKVEQSTHAYVEGEVAAIENIMAREYREKSTRRLRRSEVTETTSSDTEREQLTDTTTASRFEMQSEIAKMQQEANDIGGTSSASFKAYGAQFNIGASYANHRSKEESMRQAVSQAQDVTARALDRVVTKVHQERIEKIVEEFEENNSHGFDNRKGDKHVVGVYRWVDKLMKNQVWDYGKRLMFEFAVPQPAKIHTLATASLKNGKVIEKPVNPRKQDGIYNLKDFSKITDETIKFWSGIYNINLEKFKNLINISLPISFSTAEDYAEDSEFDEVANGKFDLEIPEGYSTTGNARIEVGIVCDDKNDPGVGAYVSVGNVRHEMIFNNANDFRQKFSRPIYDLKKYEDKIGVSFSSLGFHAGNINVDIECELNNRGKLTIYNMIIEAYETALTLYNQQIAEEETKAGNIKETNANFYRQIEQDVLKHNCIAYLVDPKVLGTKLYDKENIENFEVIKDKNLDEYASLSKFMEQAFEWNIMSYDFYPYYWGAKTDWQTLYQSESMDPLFRSFLQSGMARVVVTVRPGFEDAVQFYMTTGRLWNGGEVPVIGDSMYLSIVDELKDVKGEPHGKPWITRLPTSLTILQAESIGLKVSSALPFTKEDPLDFENPEEVITISNFFPNGAMIESGNERQVANLALDTDSLQLTTEGNEVVSELPLEDLKKALE